MIQSNTLSRDPVPPDDDTLAGEDIEHGPEGRVLLVYTIGSVANRLAILGISDDVNISSDPFTASLLPPS